MVNATQDHDHTIPAVSLANVFFNYNEDIPVLQDVSFDILPNEYVCIIGHNGSGKSTISKILVGLLRPRQGSVKIFGEQISYLNLPFLRKNVGIIFQNPDSQFIGLSARDDIVFGLENRKINASKMDDIVQFVAKTVQIDDILDRDAILLSGGQKQRVAIASVLAMNPQIIIFDEATSMLDPRGKMEIKKIMLDLKNKSKKTIISITHDMNETLQADKVIVFNKGRIVKMGHPIEVFQDANFLAANALDYPFVLKLSQILQAQNLPINITTNQTDLVKQLCKLKK